MEFYPAIRKNELDLSVWFCKKHYRRKCLINRKIFSCIWEYMFIFCRNIGTGVGAMWWMKNGWHLLTILAGGQRWLDIDLTNEQHETYKAHKAVLGSKENTNIWDAVTDLEIEFKSS